MESLISMTPHSHFLCSLNLYYTQPLSYFAAFGTIYCKFVQGSNVYDSVNMKQKSDSTDSIEVLGRPFSSFRKHKSSSRPSYAVTPYLVVAVLLLLLLLFAWRVSINFSVLWCCSIASSCGKNVLYEEINICLIYLSKIALFVVDASIAILFWSWMLHSCTCLATQYNFWECGEKEFFEALKWVYMNWYCCCTAEYLSIINISVTLRDLIWLFGKFN